MTQKERFRRCAQGLPIDRTPFFFYFGMWGETVAAWQESGVEDAGNAWCAPKFGFDNGIMTVSACTNLLYDPPLELTVLERHGDHIIYQDMHGTVLESIEGKSGIPKLIRPAVTCREDWEKLRDKHLDPNSPNRIPLDFERIVEELKTKDAPVQVGSFPYGLFGTLRDMMGVENLCYMFYDDPELIHEMMNHLTSLWLSVYEKITERIDVDIIHIWEDMSGKTGSLISPNMVREFMLPCYRRFAAFAKAHNIAVIAVDTDGICDELIPLFAEAGVNLMMPFEVAAGNDVIELRRRFPEMSMMGGIDKIEIAKGCEAIDRELDRIEPLLGKSGYFPALDHLIPPDVSYEDYCYFVNSLRERIMRNTNEI